MQLQRSSASQWPLWAKHHSMHAELEGSFIAFDKEAERKESSLQEREVVVKP